MDQKSSLSQDDMIVIELLQQANNQYEEYLTLLENLNLITPVIEPDFSGYNWDRPLTLTIKSTKCPPGSSSLISSTH